MTKLKTSLQHVHDIKAENERALEIYKKKLSDLKSQNDYFSEQMEKMRKDNVNKVKKMQDDIEDLTNKIQIISEDRNLMQAKANSYFEECEELTILNEEYENAIEANKEKLTSMENQIFSNTSTIERLRQENFTNVKNLEIQKSLANASEKSLCDLNVKFSNCSKEYEMTVKKLEGKIKENEIERFQFQKSLRTIENSKKDLSYQVCYCTL